MPVHKATLVAIALRPWKATPRRCRVRNDPTPHPPRPNSKRWLLLLFAVPTSFILILAYLPSLADSLESLVFVQPSPLLSSLQQAPDVALETPGIYTPPAIPANKAALDDDTLVIGVLASGRARATC